MTPAAVQLELIPFGPEAAPRDCDRDDKNLRASVVKESTGEPRRSLAQKGEAVAPTVSQATASPAPLNRGEGVAAAATVDLNQRSRTLTLRARRLSLEWCLPRLAREVHTQWNTRMQTAAGRAHFDGSRIELNPKLLQLPRGEEELERTFLHELAHLFAYARYPRKRIRAHGREWRQACTDLGIPDESPYHDLPLPKREIRRRYAYRCPQCDWEILRVRRMKRAVACYHCCRQFSNGNYDDRFRLTCHKL